MKKVVTIIVFFCYMSVLSTAEPTQVYFNNFDGNITVGNEITADLSSSAAVISSVGGYSSYEGFSGNFFRNSSTGNPAAPTILLLTGLPANSIVELDFSLAIINSWDGLTNVGGQIEPDFMDIMVNNSTVFTGAFDNFSSADNYFTFNGEGEIDTIVYGQELGLFGAPSAKSYWKDSGYHMNFTIENISDTLEIKWFAYGGGWQGGVDESFALDNLSVTIPEPITLSLLAIGGLLLRRKK